MSIPTFRAAFPPLKAPLLRLTLCLCIILHLTCGRKWRSPTETPEVVPTEGLVAWYPFNGNADDESSNGNHAAISGPLLSADRFGHANKAYTFDGVDDHIKLPNNLIRSCLPITIAAWFKTSKNGALIGYQNAAYRNLPNDFVPLLYIDLDGKLRGLFWPGPGGNTPTTLASTSTFMDNQWHFLVVVATALNQYLYCDGKSVASVTGRVDYRSMIYNQIGTGYSSGWVSTPGGWMMFNGVIDDVRIYNRPLTSDEIPALYHEGGFIPPLAKPILSAIGVSGSCIMVKWQHVPEGKLYQLEQSTDKAGPFKSLNSGDDTLFIHNHLTRGQRNWYRLKVKSGSRNSAWSDTVSAVALSFEGWKYNPQNGHYYYLMPGQDWLKSKDSADSLGAQLVTIRDGSESNWLAQNFRISDSDVRCAVWIGLTDEGQEGQWRWISGEAVTFSNWAWGEPNNDGGQGHYTTMDIGNRYGHLGQRNDLWHGGSGNVRGAILERTGIE